MRLSGTETFRVALGEFELSYPLWYWINDGLMAIFFFVIGLEIKREMMVGELSEPRKVVLPVAAAVGGVAVPSSIFLVRQYGEAGQAGCAIPMATDIAFVVGCLALLGSRVPHGLKILVLSLAIVDDILAVFVIAIFYTAEIKVVWLAAALGGFSLTWLLNRLESGPCRCTHSSGRRSGCARSSPACIQRWPGSRSAS